MRIGVLLAALVVLAACQPDAPERREGRELTPTARAECLAKGGRVAQGGMLGNEVCFAPQADAGKACGKASDCSGMCMAETRTCSAEAPVFGCFEMLYEEGRSVGLCVD